ncbi:ABC transporter permease [Enterococcus sp. LJL128]|uniref:ABC transporter permease n=1 Tax=Enterococcus sp. LJL51 TaxID=3416656 RepID=UPI003CEEF68D
MIRLIKADFYRLFRAKGFYITFLLIIVYAALIVISQTVGSVGVNTTDLVDSKSIVWNLTLAVQYTAFSSPFLVYFLIGLFVILLGYEFSQHTYKNSLTSGVSRLCFMLSKYVIQLTCFIVASIFYFCGSAVIAFFKYGAEGIDMGGFFWDTFKLAIGVSLVISVIFSLASLILVLSGSTVIASVFIVIYPVAIQIFAMLIDFDGLKYFDFFGLVQQIGVGAISGKELVPYIIVSLLLILLSIFGSSLTIRQKEL